MKVEFEKGLDFINKKYTLHPVEVEVLNFVQERGGIHFRDFKYGEKNPLDNTQTFDYQNSCLDLVNQGFLEEDNMNPNYYVLTPLGKFFLE